MTHHASCNNVVLTISQQEYLQQLKDNVAKGNRAYQRYETRVGTYEYYNEERKAHNDTIREYSKVTCQFITSNNGLTK